MDLRFDTYYDNDELRARLDWLVDEHRDIAELRSLGASHEGADIPMVVVTNRSTGDDAEKPGFWIDANIHATEVTGSMAALYALATLLGRYGDDDAVARRIVDEQATYIVPRLNPDGAALALAGRPLFVRSGTRPYPHADRADGLHAMDIDGDGRILQMRIADPAGDWKISGDDPRLMVKRLPDETGGEYYRLLPEGEIENYDGHIVRIAPAYRGLDFNRNFPVAWRPEGKQPGAGDYPGSEPEIQGVLAFMAAHPNIFGALTYHTYSRAILRPYGDRPDDDLDVGDLRLLEAIGERGTQITGYPCVSVYHHFRYHPKEVITGVFDDWLYDHRGILAYTVELWDLPTAAGIAEKNQEKRFIDWHRTHPPEDDSKIAAFVAANAPDGLVEWRGFDHPQLGRLEIGGWDAMYTWRNPPPEMLEAEIAPQAEFAIAFASLAPRLAWRTLDVTALGDGAFHVLAVVENQGFLATHGCNHAAAVKAVRPVRLEIALPEGATLKSGVPRTEIGHLEGRSNKLSMSYYGTSPTDNRGKAEWIVNAPSGGEVEVAAVTQRAGVLRRRVSLGARG